VFKTRACVQQHYAWRRRTAAISARSDAAGVLPAVCCPGLKYYDPANQLKEQAVEAPRDVRCER